VTAPRAAVGRGPVALRGGAGGVGRGARAMCRKGLRAEIAITALFIHTEPFWMRLDWFVHFSNLIQ